MKSIPLLIKLTLISLTLVGCSTASYKESADAANFTSRLEAKSNRAEVKTKLMAQYQEWRGVPYDHGGLSKRGVDCSGFVYLTYRNKFGINLPRSTELQSRLGIQISPREMKTGDLVFFSSLFTDTHVGIYLGKGHFLHASTSQGVMISNMNNEYWRDKFWKAQRI
jgi:murein DD-endopeptidase / murein LD-carboxypeptidase